jgi:hypothetical protein
METIENLIQTRNEIRGQLKSIHGFLVADLNQAYLFSSMNDINTEKYIRITDEEFIKSCVKKIPCHIGGAHIYFDTIFLTGIVDVHDESNAHKSVVFNKIISIELIRGDNIYKINF